MDSWPYCDIFCVFSSTVNVIRERSRECIMYSETYGSHKSSGCKKPGQSCRLRALKGQNPLHLSPPCSLMTSESTSFYYRVLFVHRPIQFQIRSIQPKWTGFKEAAAVCAHKDEDTRPSVLLIPWRFISLQLIIYQCVRLKSHIL